MAELGVPERLLIAMRMALALVRHPRLWLTAARQASRIAAPRWWARPPFLPLPDPDYLRFRLETQYGSTIGRPGGTAESFDPHDLIVYLDWCRDQDR